MDGRDGYKENTRMVQSSIPLTKETHNSRGQAYIRTPPLTVSICPTFHALQKSWPNLLVAYLLIVLYSLKFNLNFSQVIQGSSPLLLIFTCLCFKPQGIFLMFH